jgi:hypothetical protein
MIRDAHCELSSDTPPIIDATPIITSWDQEFYRKLANTSSTIPQYYEINVSKDGRHFFATAPRSITNFKECASAVDTLRKALPEDAGYKITVTAQIEFGVQCTGYIDKFIEEELHG